MPFPRDRYAYLSSATPSTTRSTRRRNISRRCGHSWQTDRPVPRYRRVAASRFLAARLSEDDRSPPVLEDASLGVPVHGPVQHQALEIAGHVVRRCTDDLHAARVRLVIRPGALEPGEEGVMDVDRAAGEMGTGL